jgi:four helix bundle protein
LRVWQAAMELAERIYHLTRGFPREELYVLTSQLRRAAVSVPSNIAEGYGRSGRKQYLSFLSIAQGSIKELETQVMLASRVGCCSDAEAEPVLELAASTARQLNALIRAIEQSAPG